MNKYVRPIPIAGNGARRRKVTARLKAEGRACHICGLPIDPQATGAYAFNCDEITPRAYGGSPYSYENLASAHACCNNWRRTKDMGRVAAIRSRVLLDYGAWTSPMEFVEHAKAVEGDEKAGRTQHRPVPSAEW